MTINPDTGLILWVPGFEQRGIHNVIVEASDSESKAVQSFRINVVDFNRVPFAENLDIVMSEDTSQTITLTGSDLDNDKLIFEIVSNPVNGELSGFNPNGQVAYTPNKNFNGEDAFTFRVGDGISYSNTGKVSIRINPVNDAPVFLTELVDRNIKVLDLFVYQISAADADNDRLSYSLIENPNGMNIDSSGKISWRADKIGRYNVVVGVSDSQITVSDEFTLVVSEREVIPAENRNPVLSVTRAGNAVSHVIINEGEGLILSLDARDADNDNLKFEALNLPIGSVFDENKKEFGWTPTNTQGGQSYVITFRVFDLENGKLKGGSDSKTVIVIVNDNLEPIAKPAGKKAVKKHVLNVKNIIVNNWETVRRGEAFAVEVVVDNKGNVKEENVKVTLSIPQLDYYERSSEFDLKKKKSENRGFLAVVPEDVEDETIYAIVTVSSNRDEVVEVIGFLVE